MFHRPARHHLRRVRLATHTSYLRWRKGRSDTGRWASMKELLHGWDERTEILATLVRPGESVLEFGAGRKVLRDLLPTGSSYIASDVVDRGPDTFICDLNDRPLPVFPRADVAVLGGVLEYLADPVAVLRHLADQGFAVVLSYADIGEFPNVYSRRRQGWISDLHADALLRGMGEVGLRPTKRSRWRGQEIIRFDPEPAHDPRLHTTSPLEKPQSEAQDPNRAGPG